MTVTWNSERVYSPVLDAAVAIGRNPAAVTRVPDSIGMAVEVYAKLAAFARSQPCSILVAIISTAMMASSTSRPRATISAPSEILCKPMSNSRMNRKVTASTTGMMIATTMPVRSPRLNKLTARTMVTASASALTNSLTERRTSRG